MNTMPAMLSWTLSIPVFFAVYFVIYGRRHIERRGPRLFARTVGLLIGAAILAVCFYSVFMLPSGGSRSVLFIALFAATGLLLIVASFGVGAVVVRKLGLLFW